MTYSSSFENNSMKFKRCVWRLTMWFSRIHIRAYYSSSFKTLVKNSLIFPDGQFQSAVVKIIREWDTTLHIVKEHCKIFYLATWLRWWYCHVTTASKVFQTFQQKETKRKQWLVVFQLQATSRNFVYCCKYGLCWWILTKARNRL